MRYVAFFGVLSIAFAAKPGMDTNTIWDLRSVSDPQITKDAKSVIYVLKGRARMRWGDHLEYVAEAGPGDFIFVPPFVPHQEINASTEETLECVLVRSDNEAVVVNLDIEPAERPEAVRWIDPIHKE